MSRIQPQDASGVAAPGGQSVSSEELLRETESRLSQARYVLEAAVLPQPDSDDRGPIALVVADRQALAEDGVVDVEGFTTFYVRVESARLPRDQRPARIVVLPNALPRTAEGVLRRADLSAVLARGGLDAAPAKGTALPDLGDDSPAQAVAAALAQFGSHMATATPADELALDLGIDSLDRLVLVEEVERLLGTSLAEQAAMSITLADLLEWAKESLERPSEPSPLARVSPRPETHALLEEAARVGAARGWLRKGIVGGFGGFLRRRLDISVRGEEFLETSGPVILCPNHQTNLDAILLMAVLPGGFLSTLWALAKSQLFTRPAINNLLYTIRLLPTDNKADFVPALRLGVLALEKGDGLVIFPEGQRALDERLGDWRPGAALLAALTGAPLLPMAIVGLHQVLGPDDKRPSFRDENRQQKKVYVAYGEPFHVETPEGGMREMVAAAREGSAELRRRVEDLMRGFPEDLRPLGL